MHIVATRYGDPDVLALVPEDPPTPGKGEVTIAVRAAGVNPRDLKSYSDKTYASSHGQKEPRFPLRLGVEAAGIVTATSDAASGPAGPIAVGDEVIAYRIVGGYADSVTVGASQVVPKPGRFSWEQAAAMMLTGTTAAHALAAVRARPGQMVLIHAAAGGVRISAVQLAALDGIRVIGTAGPKDFERLRRHGAEPVAYGDGLLDRIRAMAPDGVDAAIDLVGTDEAIDASLALVPDRSRVATVVARDRAEAEGFLALGGAPGQDPGGVAIRDAARLRLTALAQAGAYDVVVGRTFPLEQAAKAHRALAKGGGRIVLTV